MTKMMIVKNESKNWIVIAIDINHEVEPLINAKIIFAVKDRDKNVVMSKKNFIAEEEELEEKNKGISFDTDGADGKIKISIGALDTVDLEPGYYDYYLNVMIGKKRFKTITDEFIILPNGNEEKEDSKEAKEDEKELDSEIVGTIDDEDILLFAKKIQKKYFIDV